jgi:hypothetical protein
MSMHRDRVELAALRRWIRRRCKPLRNTQRMLFSVVLYCGLQSGACGMTYEAPNSNTNWLVSCTESSSCRSLRADLACVNGICVASMDRTDAGNGGSATDAGQSPVAHDGAIALPSCGWPPALDPANGGGPGGCYAARTILQCGLQGGGGVICAAKDPNGCDPPAVQTYVSCNSLCNANEYGVACPPTPQPVPSSTLPSGCHDLGGSLSGFIPDYCCPCGP